MNHRNYRNYVAPAIAVVAFLLVLAALGVNVAAFAPLGLVLLACPLMMFFMMRGMGHGDGTHTTHERDEEKEAR